MIEAPILHVNGDDPEAVVYAAKIAVEFRQKLPQARRHRHVLLPALRPQRGRRARVHPAADVQEDPRAQEPCSKSTRLSSSPRVSSPARRSRRPRPPGAPSSTRNTRPASITARTSADWLDGRWAGLRRGRRPGRGRRRGRTGVERARLVELGHRITLVPQSFHLHKTIQRLLDNRRKAVDTGQNIDWAMGEALAFASLVDEGQFAVRLSGQDSRARHLLAAPFRADRPGGPSPATCR